MRKAFCLLSSVFCLLFSVFCPPSSFSQSVIRPLAWEIDTARPAVKSWQLVRGETADLECRYLSGITAMDVRGAAVVLHCRTNGMPADLSFQITGRVGRVSSTNLAAVGWVTVRVRPDLDLPHDVPRCTFALETTLNSARNLVATGTLLISGDPTGASPAALPVFQYDPKGSAQAVSNALAAGVQAAVAPLVTTQQVAAAVAPLATTQQVAASLAPLATTQQVAAAVAPKLAAASPLSSLVAEWVDAYYDAQNSHLSVRDTATAAAVYIGPYGFGQFRHADEDVPEGVDRFLAWHEIPARAELTALSNNLSGVIGALGAADVGALPSGSGSTQLRAEWSPDVYGGTEGHLWIHDDTALPANGIYLGPYGLGQFRAADAEYPDGIDRFTRWSDFATHDDVAGVVTNGQDDVILGGAHFTKTGYDFLSYGLSTVSYNYYGFFIANGCAVGFSPSTANSGSIDAGLWRTAPGWLTIGKGLASGPQDTGSLGLSNLVVRGLITVDNGLAVTTNALGSTYVLISNGRGGTWGVPLVIDGGLFISDSEAYIRFAGGSGLNRSGFYLGTLAGGISYWDNARAAELYAIHQEQGHVSVPSGNLTVSGTNAAAAFHQTAAPAWIGTTNLASQAYTITNQYELPQYLYATGSVAVAFHGLRAPSPVYCVIRGPSAVAFLGAYVVGGGSWQTNMSNHFVVWSYGTNTLVSPVTTTED